MQTLELLVGLGFMHRSLYDAERNCIYSDAFFHVFHRQRACHGVKTALGHNLERHRYTGHGMVHEGCRNADDAAILLLTISFTTRCER